MGGTVIHTEYMYYNIVINISTRSRDHVDGTFECGKWGRTDHHQIILPRVPQAIVLFTICPSHRLTTRS